MVIVEIVQKNLICLMNIAVYMNVMSMNFVVGVIMDFIIGILKIG